jgi:hypothetical protein
LDEHTTFITHQTRALERFSDLLSSDMATDPNIKEICWTVSNIAANSVVNTQRYDDIIILTQSSIIDSGIAPHIVKYVNVNVSYAILKEAVWAVANVCSLISTNSIRVYVYQHLNKSSILSIMLQ